MTTAGPFRVAHGAPPGATKELALGRLPDAETAEMLGMQRPNANPWSPAINDAWVQGGIDAKKSFYLASKPGPPNFFNPPGSAYPETVFKREMEQLEDAGYTRAGPCMVA